MNRFDFGTVFYLITKPLYWLLMTLFAVSLILKKDRIIGTTSQVYRNVNVFGLHKLHFLKADPTYALASALEESIRYSAKKSSLN